MSKIFKYELKRIFKNKFFWGLMLIVTFISWQTLTNEVILGIANTAPFSPWSVGYFMSRCMPFLLTGLLFIVHSFFSKKEQLVGKLTKATSAEQSKYMAIRYGAATAAYLLLCFWSIMIASVYCGLIFNFSRFQEFLLPLIITIIPAMLFLMGIGITAESIKSSLIFLVMAGIIVAALLPMPYPFDIIGTQFFAKYPLELENLDPKFYLPMSVILGKSIYSIIGILLIIKGVYPNRKQAKI